MLILVLISGLLVTVPVSMAQSPSGGGKQQRSGESFSLPVDGVVAQVNDEVILASQVMEQIAPMLKILKKRSSPSKFKKRKKELFRREVTAMIRQKVVEQAAKEEDISVSDEEIERELQKDIQRAGSRKALKRELRNRGFTMERWRRKKKREILQQKLYRKRFKQSGTDLYVRPGEMKKYYRNHRSKFYREAKVKGHMISFPFSNEDEKRKAKERAEAVLEQIRSGVSMKKLVDVYKRLDPEHTRSFDFTKKGTFHRTVDEYLFEKMEGNELAGPIVLEDRVVILKRTGKIEENRRSFNDEDVQEEIRGILRSKKYREKVKNIRKQLMEEAYIKPRYLVQND